MLNGTFRAAARFVSAINQSRAKLVLDPIYYAVASSLVRDSTPCSRQLLEKDLRDNLYLKYRSQSRKLDYWIEDWDFSSARPELLTARQRAMMHTVALGETSGAAVAASFLKAFRTNPELAAFFGTWFVEELNHFLGYHLYLDRMGEAWPVERARDVAAVEFLDYAKDPREVAACNMYQELVGYLVYRSFGKQARDPFLARMLTRFAKDELRHYKFYQDVVAREIQRDPRFRKTVLKVFLKATSPINQVCDGPLDFIAHLKRGVFWFRKPELDFFLDQVEYLLGTRLESFFQWVFKGHAPPCETCAKELYLCACEVFEPDAAPLASAPVPPPPPSSKGIEWVREVMERSGAMAGSSF
jgi:hypothetical protein